MKRILIVLLSIIIVISCYSQVTAFGPHTHNSLSNSIFESDNVIGKLCSATEENKAAYKLGSVTPDLTVIYYYEAGGKEYRLSHNWNFQQEVYAQALTDDERCFAYGIASHLIADGIAHTQAVPNAIQNSKLPNWLVHPLMEKKYDSYLSLKHPELLNSTPHLMDALFGARGDRYVEMVTEAMGANSNIDAKSELTKLSFALGTFYDGQFKPQGQSWIFETYPWIDKFTNFLAPYIGTVNNAKMDDYYDKSKESILNTFNNWGARYQISPHGFTELSVADNSVNWFSYIIIGLIILVPVGLVILSRKSKFKWLWLLLIPFLLAAMVVIVYMIL